MRRKIGRPSLQHAIQGVDGNVHLGRPTLIRAAAQPVTDHLLEPTNGGFDTGSDALAECLLPCCSSVLGDALQMAIPLCWRALPPRLARPRSWRHDDQRVRMTLGECAGDAFLFVGTVRGEPGHLCRYLVEQGTNLRAILNVVGGQRRRDNLASLGVHCRCAASAKTGIF